MRRRRLGWMGLLAAGLGGAGLLAAGPGGVAASPATPAGVASADTTSMDAAWARVLWDFVDDQGRVDFRSLARDGHDLDATVASIAALAPGNAPAAFPTPADRLAFHVNAYNALAMAHVVRRGIPQRLSLTGRLGFFVLSGVTIGGRSTTLYDEENDVIRPLGDERVHFALNCMSVSCPRLPRVPFHAASLDSELDASARGFLSEARNVQVDDVRHVVRLSSILSFYKSDFLAHAPSLVDYVNRYRAAPVPAGYRVEFIPYDWTINIQPTTAQAH